LFFVLLRKKEFPDNGHDHQDDDDFVCSAWKKTKLESVRKTAFLFVEHCYKTFIVDAIVRTVIRLNGEIFEAHKYQNDLLSGLGAPLNGNTQLDVGFLFIFNVKITEVLLHTHTNKKTVKKKRRCLLLEGATSI
jgi:hypothetical protein